MLDDGTGLAALLVRGQADELERPLNIHWGAYLGTPDEMLMAGPLEEAGRGSFPHGLRRGRGRGG